MALTRMETEYLQKFMSQREIAHANPPGFEVCSNDK